MDEEVATLKQAKEVMEQEIDLIQAAHAQSEVVTSLKEGLTAVK